MHMLRQHDPRIDLERIKQSRPDNGCAQGICRIGVVGCESAPHPTPEGQASMSASRAQRVPVRSKSTPRSFYASSLTSLMRPGIAVLAHTRRAHPSLPVLMITGGHSEAAKTWCRRC